jgi:CRP/FNR family transcriptional regulator, cyclic AMP receptor protein
VAGAPLDLIKRVPLFEDLEPKELEHVAGWMKERPFTAGDTIAREGKAGVGFFVIEDGEATVNVHGEEVRTLGPGDYFGEIALIDDGARTATVTAKTDMRCWGMTSWEFRPLVESNAQVAWKLLQAMAKRVRSIEQRVA